MTIAVVGAVSVCANAAIVRRAVTDLEKLVEDLALARRSIAKYDDRTRTLEAWVELCLYVDDFIDEACCGIATDDELEGYKKKLSSVSAMVWVHFDDQIRGLLESWDRSVQKSIGIAFELGRGPALEREVEAMKHCARKLISATQSFEEPGNL